VIDTYDMDRLSDPVFLKTLDDFIGGRLDADATRELQFRLLTDDAARLIYVEYMDLHAELAGLESRLSEVESVVQDVTHLADRFYRNRAGSAIRSQRQLWGYSITMAALLIGLSVYYGWPQAILNSNWLAAPVAGRYAAPVTMTWAGSRTGQAALVRKGERLQAFRGRFLIYLDGGATAACTAPVDVQIISEDELTVHHGDVCVQVPERARGFRMNTPSMKIVDLGTLFGVRVQGDGATEMHVLEGRVQAKTDRSDFEEVPAGFARQAKVGERLTPAIPASPEVFSMQLSSLAGIAETTGGVRILSAPPESVQIKRLITPATANLFPERMNVTLTEPLSLVAANPGLYDSGHHPEIMDLPAGTVVSSYFIHAENSLPSPADGTVTFDRPILGLALKPSQLKQTDEAFGHSQVQYPTTLEKGRGTGFEEAMDEIEISPDRKTLRVRMGCSVGAFDQVRVFVAAERADNTLVKHKRPLNRRQ